MAKNVDSITRHPSIDNIRAIPAWIPASLALYIEHFFECFLIREKTFEISDGQFISACVFHQITPIIGRLRNWNAPQLESSAVQERTETSDSMPIAETAPS